MSKDRGIVLVLVDISILSILYVLYEDGDMSQGSRDAKVPCVNHYEGVWMGNMT